MKIDFDASEHDWLQLGWLVHWAHSDYEGDYHKRKFEDLDQKYKDDSFTTQLITQGKWCGFPSSIRLAYLYPFALCSLVKPN